ncbi:endonuclease [Seongchinamella sediminis]|uniref:Endonuclease n=1 Tax=Seongchinamella sediminis TaxID=2283635 RepID=A0A3L7DWU6_9GAMM|nr:endonuclease/exonuclease/phosphatase family protein [Seongchinamella sediminis]RLQ21784.1 endonuclease [Seongchinamella sediminis]
MTASLALLTLPLCLLSLLPLWQNPHWLVRSAEFARQQLACLLAVSLVAQLTLMPTATAATVTLLLLTLACLAWNLRHLLRFFPVWPREVAQASGSGTGRELAIISANVQMENREAETLLSLVRATAPDLLVALESDQWWQDQLDTLAGDLPHSVKCPLDNRYGIHLYSRLPLVDPRVEFLVEDDVPSIHATVVLASGAEVRLHLLHPAPPSPTENDESKERDAELLVVARALRGDSRPTLVAGDFNDIPWSRTATLFRRISGLVDPRVGRCMLNTFHARIPVFRWPLDHLYHSSHFRVAEIRRLPYIGSDHFPLFTRLVLAAPEREPQRPPPAPEEVAEAREITAAGEVTVDSVPEPGSSPG